MKFNGFQIKICHRLPYTLDTLFRPRPMPNPPLLGNVIYSPSDPPLLKIVCVEFHLYAIHHYHRFKNVSLVAFVCRTRSEIQVFCASRTGEERSFNVVQCVLFICFFERMKYQKS